MKKLTLLSAILIVTTIFAQVPSYVPTNGLVGWWPFNGNANDESGNGNNGTVNGATLTTDRNGVTNSAYVLSTLTNNLTINNVQPQLNNYNLTVSLWLKFPSQYNQSSLALVKNGTPYSNGFNVAIDQNNNAYGINNYLVIFIVGNGVSVSFISNQTELGAWSNIVSTYDGVNIKIYLNGVLKATQPFNQIINILDNNILIGSWDNPTTPIVQTRQLDDIGIWNRALTDCEIKNLYNSGIPSSLQTQTALDAYTWPVNNQTYTQSGTYADTLVNAAGCDSIITLNLTLSFTGINELNTSSLSISPNPTAGDFTIAGLELYNNISTMRVSDVNGKLVKELDPTATKFSLESTKSGVYFLTITAGDKQEVIKIIKE